MLESDRSTEKESLSLVAGRLVRWLLTSGVILAALALTAIYAPARIKLLGLFSLAYGLLAGFLLGQLGRWLHVHYSRAVVVSSFVLIATAQIGIAVESHRLHVAQWKTSEQRKEDNPITALMRLQQAKVPDDPEMRKDYEEMEQTLLRAEEEYRKQVAEQTSFPAYLQARISPLGKWPTPWPAVFWGTEVLLSSLLGSWLAFRFTSGRYCVTCRSWQEVQQSSVLKPEQGEEVLQLLNLSLPENISSRSLIVVTYSGCRCADRIPIVDCWLEEESGSRRHLGRAEPDASLFRRLSGLLA